jgi:hypothetical protein
MTNQPKKTDLLLLKKYYATFKNQVFYNDNSFSDWCLEYKFCYYMLGQIINEKLNYSKKSNPKKNFTLTFNPKTHQYFKSSYFLIPRLSLTIFTERFF